MSDATLLATIKSNYLTALATESANPKPTYSVDGQNVNWDSYRASLLKAIADIDAAMAAATGPWEVSAEGIP